VKHAEKNVKILINKSNVINITMSR